MPPQLQLALVLSPENTEKEGNSIWDLINGVFHLAMYDVQFRYRCCSKPSGLLSFSELQISLHLQCCRHFTLYFEIADFGLWTGYVYPNKNKPKTLFPPVIWERIQTNNQIPLPCNEAKVIFCKVDFM